MKILFLDAFKPDYLRDAPYLRSLSERFRHGHVITPQGFWGAMETFFRGSSDTLALFKRSRCSSLAWTRPVRFLGHLPLSILINLIRLAKNQRPFFRLRQNLPLEKLHYFDVAVNQGMGRGLPHQLRCFHELDTIGHRYGPESPEIRKAVARLDQKIEKVPFDMMISDHGMGTVERRITVPETRICFLDSTMARYWDQKPEIPPEFGTWIPGREAYGRYIFLAHPGVLFAPNYWSEGNEKGMHGWNPSHPDMHAFYLIKTPGGREDMDMKKLHRYVAPQSAAPAHPNHDDR